MQAVVCRRGGGPGHPTREGNSDSYFEINAHMLKEIV